MASDLQRLIELDQIDREISRLKNEVAALPKHLAAIETKLAGVKAQVERAQADIKTAEKTRKEYESDIQSFEGKISKFKEQQLSVKTNEQYRALVHEIEFSQTEIRGREDKILDIMERSEALNAGLKAAQTEMQRQSAEVEKEKDHTRSLTQQDEQELAALDAKRNELRTGVDANVLYIYDRILKSRGNALAEARNQKCSACSVLLRPQKYMEVRNGGEAQTCDSCGRILFYDSENAVPEQVKAASSSRGKQSTQRAWYFSETQHDVPAYIAFANHMGSCSMRSYDARTGIALHPVDRRPGAVFSSAFAPVIQQSVRLCEAVEDQDLEAWESSIPTGVLDELASYRERFIPANA